MLEVIKKELGAEFDIGLDLGLVIAILSMLKLECSRKKYQQHHFSICLSLPTGSRSNVSRKYKANTNQI